MTSLKSILTGATALVAPLALAAAISMSPATLTSPAHAIDASASIAEQVQQTQYKTVKVGDVEVFYREAGTKGKPVLLLLHGFPSSSHMFRNLIPLLADDYHVIAPDYPGFGSTKAPARGEFDYTFDNLYKTVEGFTEALKLDKYAMYVFDYGAPIGFRLATAYPEKVTAIVSQNGNAYDVGITDAWAPIRAYWDTSAKAERDQIRGLLTPETTHFQYTSGVAKDRLHLVSPDPIAHDQAILDRDNELQLDLLGDYKTNVALYPQWQEYFRTQQPPMLAVWGKNDPFFAKEGATAFKRDLPNAEIHLLDSGHFAIESHVKEIAVLMKDFLGRNIK